MALFSPANDPSNVSAASSDSVSANGRLESPLDTSSVSVDGLDLSRDRIFVASPPCDAHPVEGVATRPRRGDRRASSPPPFPQVGSEFVGFRLIGELGRGTFGRVYLGRQGELAGRLVALKVSTEVLAESQKLARLQHSHIVPIHSLHREGPLQAVCMPFFGSTTLADVLRDLGRLDGLPASGKGLLETLEERKSRTKATLDRSDSARGSPPTRPGPESADFSPLPGEIRRDLLDAPTTLRHLEGLTYVEAVLWMGACLAHGLHHAHERGIIHRDLKPANVLLADDGRPMLLDFNLADDLAARRESVDRPVGGTLSYMSPEHLAAFLGLPSPVPASGIGPRVDARSDVYSLGVILCELLTGIHPFTRLPGPVESSVPAMIEERLGAPPAIRSRNLLVSPAVESILHKCLQADPAQRYQSARDLHDDLQRQLLHEPLLHAREPSWGERVRKWGRRHPRLSSSTTVLAVAGVLFLSLVLALVSRSRRLDRLESQDRLLAFEELSRPAGLFLSSRFDDERERLEGREMGLRALALYGVLDRDDWRDDKRVEALDESSRRRLSQEMGEMLLLMGYESKPDEGLVLSDRAMACYADNAPRSLWQQRADLLDRLGRADHAIDARRRAVEAKGADEAGDHYLEAIALIRKGDYPKAVAELTKAVAIEPDHIGARYALGNCCLDGFQEAHGRTLEAVGHFTVCVGLRPRFALAWYGRGLAELRLSRYASAEADLGRALQLRPELTQALVARAIALDRQKKPREAVADLDEALKRRGARTRPLLLRSELHKKLGDHAAAKRDHEEALRLTPTDEEGWIARGVARAATDPRGALSDFAKAVELNPRSLPGWYNQANLFAEMKGKTEEAIAMLDQVARLFPDYVPAIASRGVLHARLGKDAAALKDARAALAVADDAPAMLFQVAGIYSLCSLRDKKHRDESIRLLASALQGGYGHHLITIDDDLKPLHADERYLALVQAAKTVRASSAK